MYLIYCKIKWEIVKKVQTTKQEFLLMYSPQHPISYKSRLNTVLKTYPTSISESIFNKHFFPERLDDLLCLSHAKKKSGYLNVESCWLVNDLYSHSDETYPCLACSCSHSPLSIISLLFTCSVTTKTNVFRQSVVTCFLAGEVKLSWVIML